MHLFIINCSPRVESKSNTTKIVNAFARGYAKNNTTYEIWHLCNKSTWPQIKEAFENNTQILFASPLYVENLPGLMLEFLASLAKKNKEDTKISFILQGGFDEASQLRCAESYIETLPKRLGCIYGGTLIKGGLFGLQLISQKVEDKMLIPFEEQGELFGKTYDFFSKEAKSFAGDDYLPERVIKRYNRYGHILQKFFMNRIAKKLGCKGKVDDKPYIEYLK